MNTLNLGILSSNFILVIFALLTLFFILLTSKKKDKARLYSSVSAKLTKITILLAISVVLLQIFIFPLNIQVSLVSPVVSYIAGLIIPFFSFGILYKRSNSRFLQIIFIFNILCNTFFLTITNSVASNSSLLIETLFSTGGVVILNIIAHAFVHLGQYIALFVSQRSQTNNHKKATYHSTDDQMLAHYLDHGLTHDEISYFREQMATAREQIKTIEANNSQAAKLRAIDARQNTLSTCQNYFKDIVEEPERVVDASEFLFKLLPSLVDLTKKYIEINGHVAKNKQSYLILDKSAQVIELLSEEINESYIQFHSETYSQMNEEIEYATRIINRSNDNQSQTTTEESADSIDTMLDEMNDFEEPRNGEDTYE